MNRIKKAASLTLIAALLTTMSCMGQSDPQTPSDSSGAPTETEAETQSIIEKLGSKDFGGQTFTILDAVDHPDIQSNVAPDTQTGDIIYDSLYKRDLFLEDHYGIDVRYVQVQNAVNGLNQLKNSVLAGDNEFQLCTSSILGGALGNFATQNILANLLELPHLELDQKWWSPLMYESMRLNNKMYYTTGDISPIMYQIPACMYLNKTLLEKYSIDLDFYSLVNEGKWTVDVFDELIKDKRVDLNGDGKWTEADDQFGFVSFYSDLSANTWLTALGVNLSQLSDDRKSLSVNLNTEKTLDIIERIRSIYGEKVAAKQGDVIDVTQLFIEDRTLACNHFVEIAMIELRDMNSDFYVLPMPKYNEQQTDYRSFVNAWASAFIAVPTTADPELSGFITEAMARYSYLNIRPQVYDLVCKQKAIRDEESAQMLDIIFETTYLDFNAIYNFGGTLDTVRLYLLDKAQLVSSMAAAETKVEAEIDKLIEAWQ